MDMQTSTFQMQKLNTLRSRVVSAERKNGHVHSIGRDRLHDNLLKLMPMMNFIRWLG